MTFMYAWCIVGVAGGLMWSYGSYTFHSVIFRVLVGALLGPIAMLIAVAERGRD